MPQSHQIISYKYNTFQDLFVSKITIELVGKKNKPSSFI